MKEQKNTTKEKENTTDKKCNLKNDIIFKTFFSRKGNEEFLIDFLSALLKIEIHRIIIKEEVNLEKLKYEEKGGRLDLQAELNNGIIVNIELQINNEHNILQRTAFYSSKVMSRATKRCINYRNINQVIMINILDFELFGFDEYVSRTAIVLDKHRNFEALKDLQWYFIELPKFRKIHPDMNEKLDQWLVFIDDYNKEMVRVAEKKNKVIEKARIEMNYLTGDDEIRRLVELREKWEMDYNSGISYAKSEGIAEGKNIGKAEGEIKKQKEIAKSMLKENMSIDLISKLTKLSLEEIKSMQKEL